MTDKRILILGSMGEFVELASMAKARGATVYVCDRYPDGPAKKVADKAFTIDVGETERIAKLCRRERIDNIITSFSDYLLECMVKIADQAGIPCYLKPEQLDYYRNKAIMKDMFATLGIGTPKYQRLEKDFADQQLSGFRFPVVVKPLDKYGSRGVMVLDNIAGIRQYFDECCKTSDIKTILVEEYNQDHEFNMMTWIHHGEVYVLSIADREKTPIGAGEIPISTRNVYPSRLFDQVYQEAKEIVSKIVAFTGQTEGACSMQFFWSKDNGIQVCEAAARFFGYEHELLEYSSGYKIEDLLLDYAYHEPTLKKRLQEHNPRLDSISSVLYFHGREKVIRDQSAAARLGSLPAVKMCELFYQEGEKVEKFGSKPYVVRCYITGNSFWEIDQQTAVIFQEISVLDGDNEEILYKNKIPNYAV